MTEVTANEASSPPIIGKITTQDLTAALKAGWKDFTKAPLFGLFFASFFVIGGWLIYLQLDYIERSYWIIPSAFGFPLLAPFLAVGLYSVSRHLETGEPLVWSEILGAVFREKDRQMPSMAVVIIMIFLFWIFIAHMIFALFLGLAPMTNILTDWQTTIFSADGLKMLAMGSLVGAGLGLVLYALTVVSLPMLLDREIDFITAMITSWQLVAQNPGPMLLWAGLIAGLLVVALIPAFLGLFIIMPLLGHASWHLYRRAIRFDD